MKLGSGSSNFASSIRRKIEMNKTQSVENSNIFQSKTPNFFRKLTFGISSRQTTLRLCLLTRNKNGNELK